MECEGRYRARCLADSESGTGAVAELDRLIGLGTEMLNWFRLKACAKCGGDLAQDDGDWICLQCGTYDYIGLYSNKNVLPRPQLQSSPEEKSGLDIGYWKTFQLPEGAWGHWVAPPILAATYR